MKSLLWHSNAPWTGTGYGAQTALFLPRLAKHYNVIASAFYGLEGSVQPWEGIPVLPGIGSTYGNETIRDHFRTSKAELVVTLMDVWVLNPQLWSEMPVASWVPVDHDPAPDPVLDFFHQSGAVPLAMSKFGHAQLRRAGLDPLYVPHAVDTDALRPLDRAESRQAIGVDPDVFLVGMVAANKGNPSRKCFPEAFLAFKELHDRHPEARLYLHTEAMGRFGGVNIPATLERCGVSQEAVIYCDQYRAVHYPFGLEQMARIYSSMDVLLSPSAGEGFGIPVVEAQACGVPVIVSDFSAQPELCGAGWTVGGGRTLTAIGSWQFAPDVGEIVEALEAAYEQSHGESRELSEKARSHALDYDIEHVLNNYMLPALEEASERASVEELVA